MINFIKGIVGGIGNIVPGLSGSALFVIFGLYEKCLDAIKNIIKFQDIKKNICFLMPIILGVGIGTIFFGRILLYFIKMNALVTSYAFFGFIVGTIPLLFKEANLKGFKKKYLLSFSAAFIIGIILLFLENSQVSQLTSIDLFQEIFLGIILAFATIIPGISATVLLTMLGFYELYLKGVASFNILFLVPVGIGYIIGGIFFSLLMSFLIKRYYGFTYYAIAGFVIATIPAILVSGLKINGEGLICLIVFSITFLITYFVSKIKVKFK